LRAKALLVRARCNNAREVQAFIRTSDLLTISFDIPACTAIANSATRFWSEGRR
jgi:hypothetical protein